MGALAPYSRILSGNASQAAGNFGTAPALTITFNSAVPSNQWAIVLYASNNPIFAVQPYGNPSYVNGDNLSAYNALGGEAIRLMSNWEIGNSNPGPYCLWFPDGPTNTGMLMRSGTGAPSANTVGPSQEGDQYTDRAGTPLSCGGSGKWYQCVAAGSPNGTPGTWRVVA